MQKQSKIFIIKIFVYTHDVNQGERKGMATAGVVVKYHHQDQESNLRGAVS